MKNKVIGAAASTSLLLALAAAAVAQTKTTGPLPAIQVCIVENGAAVVTPRDGSCPRGALAELAQHADVEQLYERLATFEASLSNVEKHLPHIAHSWMRTQRTSPKSRHRSVAPSTSSGFSSR